MAQEILKVKQVATRIQEVVRKGMAENMRDGSMFRNVSSRNNVAE